MIEAGFTGLDADFLVAAGHVVAVLLGYLAVLYGWHRRRRAPEADTARWTLLWVGGLVFANYNLFQLLTRHALVAFALTGLLLVAAVWHQLSLVRPGHRT